MHYSENGIPAFRIQLREIIESSTHDTVHLSSSMVISLQHDQRGVYGRWREWLHCVVKRPQGTGGFLSASSQAATPAQLPMTKCTADDAHDRRKSSIQPARGAFLPIRLQHWTPLIPTFVSLHHHHHSIAIFHAGGQSTLHYI